MQPNEDDKSIRIKIYNAQEYLGHKFLIQKEYESNDIFGAMKNNRQIICTNCGIHLEIIKYLVSKRIYIEIDNIAINLLPSCEEYTMQRVLG